tara:strand:- start:4888 stop:5706 length:819 start_codon:yes stop_codon:yes gene_type:complete
MMLSFTFNIIFSNGKNIEISEHSKPQKKVYPLEERQNSKNRLAKISHRLSILQKSRSQSDIAEEMLERANSNSCITTEPPKEQSDMIQKDQPDMIRTVSGFWSLVTDSRSDCRTEEPPVSECRTGEPPASECRTGEPPASEGKTKDFSNSDYVNQSRTKDVSSIANLSDLDNFYDENGNLIIPASPTRSVNSSVNDNITMRSVNSSVHEDVATVSSSANNNQTLDLHKVFVRSNSSVYSSCVFKQNRSQINNSCLTAKGCNFFIVPPSRSDR